MDSIEFQDLPEDIRDALEMVFIPGQDEAESMATLKKVTQSYPGFIPARLNLASMLLEAGDTDGSEAAYRSVLSDFPDDARAVGGLATVYADRKEFERAEEEAKKAIEAGYDWAPLYEVMAEAREHAGDLPSASDAYLQGYRLSPHAWKSLENYCRLNDRPFRSPMDDEVPQPVSDEMLNSLFEYIEEAAHTVDQDGNIPGCDHTFRFSEQWAQENNVDIIELYQFLNANGGFCDCEVCYNVATEFDDDLDEDFDDEEFGDE